MKPAQKLSLAVLLLTLMAPLAHAGPSIVGAWKGHVVMDVSKLTVKDPKVKKQIMQGVAWSKSTIITVNFKADKTYVATSKGGPAPSSADYGKWSQSGNTLTMVSSKNKNGGFERFVLSADGKSMTMKLPDQMGIVSKIVLTR